MIYVFIFLGIPLEKRFAFYDQVHTTGMDIQHVLSASAALTLGKDMTWRDYAQGKLISFTKNKK